MSVADDLLAYTDANGLVQPIKNPAPDSSGNGLLYAAEAVVALSDNAALTDSLKIAFRLAYAQCQPTPGLMRRNPDQDSQEGPDDNFGCGLASAFMDDHGELAEGILHYGETALCCDWDSSDTASGSQVVYKILRAVNPNGIPHVYNNKNPGKFSLQAWLGRFPHLQAHLAYAAGQQPALWRRLWWSASLVIGSMSAKDSRDSWVMSWACVRTWEKRCGKGLPERLAVSMWRKKFASVYGNPGQLLSDYFANPLHPLAVWLKNSN